MAISKEEFKNALREAISSEFSHIPNSESEICYSFSNLFEKRMNKLIKKQKNMWWNLSNTISKRVAIALISTVLLFTTACGFENIREPIVSFIREVHDKFIQYFFDGDTCKEISYEYQIKLLPEGFEKMNTICIDNSIVTTYENQKGNIIDFTQSTTQIATHSFDNEHGKITTVTVDDIRIDFYIHEELITALWLEDAYYFKLTYYGNTSQEILLEIIKSIQ